MTMFRPTAMIAKISMNTTTGSLGSGSGIDRLIGWKNTSLMTGYRKIATTSAVSRIVRRRLRASAAR